MKEIRLAETAGFCFGVNRAVNKTFEIAQSGEKAATLGPIIHNPEVVDRLRRQGIRDKSLSEIEEGETVIIRSHGVGKSVYEMLKGHKIVDCTCPFVEKIHRIVAEESQKGRDILIIGDPSHPEVQGIMGHASGKATAVEDEKGLSDFLRKESETVRSRCRLWFRPPFRKKAG